MSYSITAEKFARVIAKVYEPDLDWDNPAEYDLIDRETLTGQARKILDRLKWDGFVVQELDDLALDEFDVKEAAHNATEPQGEPTDAQLSEIEQRVYDEHRGMVAGFAKALIRAGWKAALRAARQSLTAP